MTKMSFFTNDKLKCPTNTYVNLVLHTNLHLSHLVLVSALVDARDLCDPHERLLRLLPPPVLPRRQVRRPLGLVVAGRRGVIPAFRSVISTLEIQDVILP